jgi:hypothetical protein
MVKNIFAVAKVAFTVSDAKKGPRYARKKNAHQPSGWTAQQVSL